MILSIVDAEDLYLSAKAVTVTMMSELEAKWHEPALKKLEKMMQVMSERQPAQPPIQPVPEEDYGAYKQQLL